jgi:poly(hydroxyalkanoate) depolymerase family esterase
MSFKGSTMNRILSRDMLGALRLTGQGRVGEAMARLREALAPIGAPAPGEPAAPEPQADMLRRVFSPVMPKMFEPAAAPRVRPPPDGANFTERQFANAAGSRSYKLFVPSGLEGKSVPLVVMLHGCTQSPDDFAAGTRMNVLAEQQKFLVAYPAQSRTANFSKCWNWFRVDDQKRGQGEPSLIAGITREIMRDYPVRPDQVYIAGLSAGGAAAAVMGWAYPELYTAIGVHSGLACGAAHDMPSAMAAMRQGGVGSFAAGARVVPTIVFHGDQDKTVNVVNGNQVIAQAKGSATLRRSVVEGDSPGGVRYTRTVQSDDAGRPLLEAWVLHGAGHAWSGGDAAGTYTDPRGPDASREMLCFFLQQSPQTAR